MFRIIKPYTLDKDLGAYYNREMEALPDDQDWCIFVDGDACFTTPNHGHQIQDIFNAHPEYGLFTCMTNRVGTKYQCIEGLFHETDFRHIFQKGKNVQVHDYLKVQDITNEDPLSGVMIALRKAEWKKSGGFKEGIGFLGVDNSIHYAIRNAGGKVGLMKGVVLFHYYRMLTGVNDKSHLV